MVAFCLADLREYVAAMRKVSTAPARQLRSASGRYSLSRRWLSQSRFASAVGELRAESLTAAVDSPTHRTNRLARLEAVLFLAREPLSSRKLAQLASLADGTEARTLVRKLAEMYKTRRTAFAVVEVAGGFRLFTHSKFAPWLRTLQSTPGELRLSAPAMETLAVVAYRQPVGRAEIEAIRGVQCGEILRQLMERDLIRIAGRSPELGRPFLYGSTRRFLETFGLRHLDDLPRAEEYRAAQIVPTPAVANEGDGRQDNGSKLSQQQRPEEESEVSIIAEETQELEVRHPESTVITSAIDDEEYEFEDDEDVDDDEDDDEFEDYDEDDEEFDDDEEDDDEDLDDDEELEGDWEEVDDEDLEYEDDEEDDDEWDDDDDEEWDDEEEDDDWE